DILPGHGEITLPHHEVRVPRKGRIGEGQHRRPGSHGRKARVLDRLVRLVLQRQDHHHRRRQAPAGAGRLEPDRGGQQRSRRLVVPPEEEDFAKLLAEYERPRRDPRVGEHVRGRVVSIGADAVFVDIGAKSEGMIDLAELRDREGKLHVAVGDTGEATVVDTDGKAGCVVLRVLLGRGPDARAELEQAHAAGIPVEGTVSGVNKGGVDVQIAGVRAFCPVSQLDLHHVDNPASFVGQGLQFRITRMEGSGRHLNLVVSRRALLEEEQRARAAETRARLQVGLVIKGTVTSLKDYGAFVDIGGLEGLLHVSELGFGRVGHPKEVLSIGQTVEVQVLRIEKEKLSLSLKSLARDPWLDAAERYRAGQSIRGTVTRTEPFGVFVEIEPGIEGLLHKSQLGEAAPKGWKVGLSVDATILAVEADKRRISLSLEPPEDDAPQGPSSSGTPGFGTFGDLFKKKR